MTTTNVDFGTPTPNAAYFAGAGANQSLISPNNPNPLYRPSTSSSVLGSTPINSTPNANDISTVTPAQSPQITTQSSATPNAQAVIGNVGAMNGNNGQTLTPSQTALLNTTDTNTQNAQDTYNTDKANTTSLINQYLGQGADQAQMEQQAGVPQLQTQSNQLSQQYLAAQGIYNQQYNSIINTPGMTREQAAQQIDVLQQQHGYNLTDIGIRQSIAQNDYNNAENLIQHQIQLKYGALKDAITFGQQFLATDANLLSSKQQQSFQANLQVQQQMYTQQTYYAQLNANTSMDMLKAAQANNAPQDVISKMGQVIAQGGSAAEVAKAGVGYTGSGNFTPVQTGIDLNTGLPIYSSYNTKTGQMEVKNPANSLGVTGSQDTVVNGIQLGVTTTLGSYAQNNNGTTNMQQITNVKSTDAKIQATVGQITDAKTAQLALNVVSPKSPITGEMLMTASQLYPNVPISTAIAVMQAETQCGTDGSKGSQLCNWGNVGNTNNAMANGKPVAMGAQEGVNAVFANLAKRAVQPNQIDPAQPGLNGEPLTPQQVATQTISAAPALLQPAMAFTASTGSTYIDMTKVPSNLQVVMQSYASSHKIPVLNSDQVSIVKGADEAIRNITNVVAPTWQKIAPEGTLGKIGTQTESIFGGLLDTDKNAMIKTFNSNRENLAQQIKALSQSAPKGSLLATAEAALPSMSGYGFHFGTGTLDSKKVGNEKMQKTLDLLSQTLSTFLPGSQPVKLQVDQQTESPASFKLPSGVTVARQADGTYK